MSVLNKLPNPPFQWLDPKKTPKQWADWLDNAKGDPGAERTTCFAVGFAHRIEERLKAGDTFAIAANVARVTADDEEEPLKDGEYWLAIRILHAYWKEAEELRKWHNLRTNRVEAEVVNASEGGKLL